MFLVSIFLNRIKQQQFIFSTLQYLGLRKKNSKQAYKLFLGLLFSAAVRFCNIFLHPNPKIQVLQISHTKSLSQTGFYDIA